MVHQRQDSFYEHYDVEPATSLLSPASGVLGPPPEEEKPHINLRRVTLAFFVTGAIFLFLLLLPTLNGSWGRLEPVLCEHHRCACEKQKHSLLQQPIDAWSTISYTLVAGFIFSTIQWDPKWMRPFTTTVTVALTAFNLTLSFQYASLTLASEYMTMGVAWALLDIIVIFQLYRLQVVFCKKWLHGFGVYVLALVVTVASTIVVQSVIAKLCIFCGVALLIFILEGWIYYWIRPKAERKLLFIVLVLFLSGVICFVVDHVRAICFPKSWFQGVSAAHIFWASAMCLLVSYYRSECWCKDGPGKGVYIDPLL